MFHPFRPKTLLLFVSMLASTACGNDKVSSGATATPTPATPSTPGSSSGNGTGTTVITPPTSPIVATKFDAQLRVLDIDGAAVSAATFVTSSGSYMADANGLISIPNVSTTGSVVGSVSAAGFMTLPVKISSATASGRAIAVTLSHPELSVVFTAASPATVELHGGKISFAANNFVQVADTNTTMFMAFLSVDPNATYDGNVNISAKSLSPATEVLQTYSTSSVFGIRTDFDTASVPAGAGRVYLADGSAMNAFPEASMQLNVTDGNGVALQLQAGVPATVRLPLTPFTSHALGDTLPLLFYQNDSDAWVQQGNCLVEAGLAAGVALECVGSVSQLGTIGVPAAPTTAGFPCTNFNVTFAPDLAVSQVTTWVEEVYTTASTPKSRNTAFNDDGTLCYVGGAPQVVVKAQATIDGNITVFSSATLSPGLVVEGSSDLMEFDAGQNAHACFRCVNTNVTFGSSDAQVGVDKDADGYFAYANSTIGNADCDDNDPTTHPGAAETACDHTDKNCDGITPSGAVTVQPAADAATWNNVYCKLSCAVHTTEVPGNNIDENCDGIISDGDNDGFFGAGDPAYAGVKALGVRSDCDDANAAINPNSSEVAANSADEDCDGYAVDVDGDGQLSPVASGVNLQNVVGLQTLNNSALRLSDCADFDASVYFGAAVGHRESVLARFYASTGSNAPLQRNQALCQYIGADGTLNAAGKLLLVDVNCDGVYSDLDGDGYTAAGDSALGNANDVDCNDFDPRVNVQSSCTVDANVALADGGTCAPGGAAVTATCAAGFALNHATGACQDINECAASNSPCASQQTCVNTVGSYQCVAVQTPLVGGLWTLRAVNANSLQARFACAVGGTGSITYAVYLRTGSAITGKTIADITAQASIAARADTCDAVTLPVANANTLYGAAVVATDSNGISVLYPPQTVRTPSVPLMAGQSTVLSTDASDITLQFSAASGGTPPYSYAVYAQQGGFGNTNITTFVTTNKPQLTASAAGSVTLSSLGALTAYGVVVVAVDASGSLVLYETLQAQTGAAVKQFFSVNTGGNAIGGVAGADALCNANLPAGISRAAALISDGQTRVACTTSFCSSGASENVNWVLQPQTTYISATGATVGTTTAAGIFTIPLSAPPVINGGEWFSGLYSDWTSNGDNCAAWTTNGGTGGVGQLGNIDGGFLLVYSQFCNRPDFVLCVQQ